MEFSRVLIGCEAGTATVERTALLLTVGVGFAAAVVGLGPYLLEYHDAIEFVLALPIP